MRRIPRIALFLAFAVSARAQSPEASSAGATSSGSSEVSPSAKPETKKTIWSAYVLDNGAPVNIEGFALPVKSLPVLLVPKDGKLRPFVEVNVTLNHPGWELMVQAGKELRKAKVTEKGYVVYAFLTAAYSEVTFVAQGPAGATQTQKIVIFSPEAQEYRIGADWGEFTLAVGAGSFKYFQTGSGDFASKVAVQSLEYASPAFASRFGVKVLVRSPVWTIDSAPLEVDPDLIEAKLDASYALLRPSTTGRWRGDLMLGAGYLTLLRNGAPFGFSNLIAIDAGAAVHFQFHENRRVSLVLNLVPMSMNLLSERNLGLRLIFRQRLPNLHHFQTELAYSGLKYHPQENVLVKASLWSLLFGYTF